MTAKQTRVAKIIASPPPLYGAIDLGTNSCRLLIAKVTNNGIKIVDAYSKSVRLGEGLNKTGKLNKNAKQRTMASLKSIKQKIQKHNIISLRAVATEACRQARDGQEFLAQIKRDIGIDFEIIDNKEEAILASEGCSSLLFPNIKNALIFDIGGGSTQLSWLENQAVKSTLSIPYGVVTLTDKIGTDTLSSSAFVEKVSFIQEYMQELFSDIHSGNDRYQLLGTSGTITTLTGTLLNLRQYNRDRVDGQTVLRSDLLNLTRDLASMTTAERCKIPCIGTERAQLMMAGCVILHAICGMCQTNEILVADRGIREGILLRLINNTQKEKRID